jgi:hypothetical protein
MVPHTWLLAKNVDNSLIVLALTRIVSFGVVNKGKSRTSSQGQRIIWQNFRMQLYEFNSI